MEKGIFMAAMLAKVMSKADVVDALQRSIDEFRNAQLKGETGDKEFSHLGTVALLVKLKEINADPIEIVQEYTKASHIHDMLNPNKS